MKDYHRFSEIQKFRQWWLWFILAIIEGVMVFFILTQVLIGKPFGSSVVGNVIFLIVFLFMLILSFFIFIMKLETRISDSGIAVRFYPFQLKFRNYKWEDFEEAYLREYSPIAEYGGWGIRYSLVGKGRALNVSGRMGLQLVFKDGRRLLIGTSKPEDITQILSVLGR